MDASRTLITKNNKGAVVIFTAIFLMLVVSAILLVAVDFGFMYVNKAKLQNAADAGALAGAGRLNKQPLGNFTGARRGAEYFANVNFNLTLDQNPNNLQEGDIVLGIWDPSATNKFTPRPAYTPFSTANAVKVTARRTGQTGTGIGTSSKVPLFFGKFFGNIFSFNNTSTMGAKASAIAWRPPRARTYFMIGRQVCNTPNSSLPLTLSPTSNNMAWTSLLDNVSDANSIKNDFFCPADKIPFVEVCNLPVYTTNGIDGVVFKAVETDFYDPNYDKDAKTFFEYKNKTYVDTWNVIVPVSKLDDPSKQPGPHEIWGYAEILLGTVCGAGTGNACAKPRDDFTAPDIDCNKIKDHSTNPPTEVNESNQIVILSIRCIDCANRWSLMGAKPILAQ